MIEKKLEDLRHGFLLGNTEKARVWQAISQKTAPENTWYYKLIERGFVPKMVAASLITVLFISLIPRFDTSVHDGKLIVKYIFGEVSVVRAANFINVVDEEPLNVGDYVFVKEAGQAKIVSSKGYELTLNGNSVVEVTPKLSIVTAEKTSIPFDDYALNLHRGQILGSASNLIQSSLPIVASSQVVYSENKGVFSISIDQKDNVNIRSLAGVVTVHDTLGSVQDGLSSATKLLAGYNAYKSSLNTQNVLLVRRDNQALGASKLDTSDSNQSALSALTEEQISQVQSKLVFLNIKLNQGIVEWFTKKDSANIAVWQDIYTRVSEISQMLGFENIKGDDENTVGDVYSAIAGNNIQALLSFVKTAYEADAGASNIISGLSNINATVKTLSDSLVLGSSIDLNAFGDDFNNLSLNMKVAVILTFLDDSILDKKDKQNVHVYVTELIAEEADKIVNMQGQSRIDSLEGLLNILSKSTVVAGLIQILQSKLPDYYAPFFDQR